MIKRALTLLEVIVSVAIVTTGLLLLQLSITDNIDKTDRAVKRRAASTLARQKLEEYLAEGSAGGTEGTFEDQGFPNYRWQVVQEEVAIGEAQSMQRIKITVRFASEDSSDGDASRDPSTDQNNNYSLVTFTSSAEVE